MYQKRSVFWEEERKRASVTCSDSGRQAAGTGKDSLKKGPEFIN